MRGLREGYGEEEDEVKGPSLIFGAPINPNSDTVPVLFGKFVRYFLSKGMSFSEIFEKQVPFKEVQMVQKRIQVEGDQIQLGNHTKNPYVVGELFKMYLVSLPEPLLTYSFYDSFISVTNILHHKNQMTVLRYLLLSLPKGYRICVKTLLSLFNRISEGNIPTIERIASLFGAIFLRPEKDVFYMKDDASSIQYLIILLILECDSLLKPPPEKRTREEELVSLSGLYNGMRNRSEITYFPHFLIDPLNAENMSKLHSFHSRSDGTPIPTPSIVAESSNPQFSSLLSPTRDNLLSQIEMPRVDSSSTLSAQFIGDKSLDTSIETPVSTPSFPSPSVGPTSSSSSNPQLVPTLDYDFFAPAPWATASTDAMLSPMRSDGYDPDGDSSNDPQRPKPMSHHEDLISTHSFDTNLNHSLLDALDTPISSSSVSLASGSVPTITPDNYLVPNLFASQDSFLPAVDAFSKPAQNSSDIPIFLDDSASLL